MRLIVRVALLLLSLSPIVSIFFKNHLDREYYWAFGTITTAILLVFLVIKYSKAQVIKVPRYISYLILGFIFYFLRGIINQFENYGSISSFIYRNPTLYSAAIFLLIENTKVKRNEINLYNKIFIITILVAFITTIYQVLVDSSFFMPQNDINYELKDFGETRFLSIFAYSNMFDIGMSFIPIVALVLNQDNIKSKKYFSLLIMFISAIVVFYSGTRWVFLGYLIILFPLFKTRKFMLQAFSITIVGYLVFNLIISTGFDVQNFYENRLMSESYTTRISAFYNFIDLFPKHPFFGTGIHVDENLSKVLNGSSQMHVGYLSHLYEYGLVGSFFWFAAIYTLTKRLYFQSKISGNWGGFSGFLVYVSANLTLVAYSFYFYGIIFCVLYSKYYYDKAIENKYIENTYENSSNNPHL